MTGQLRIVADENIPHVEAALAGLGEIRTMAGRAMKAEDIAGCDVLWVRSVTRVDRNLLGDAPPTFVGTATAGVEHIDQRYLQRANVRFAAAPGSNAPGVAEWVTASLMRWSRCTGRSLDSATLGVVGVGQVGRRVADKGRALGMSVVLNDPPRARREGEAGFWGLPALLERADVVTLHTPLTRRGLDPTFRLIDAEALSTMKRGASLFNAARGDVIDGDAVLAAKRSGALAFLALDCWPGEPRPDRKLVAAADIATPHIAGYALDGKVRGTQMLYDAMARCFGLVPRFSVQDVLPPPPPSLHAEGLALEDVVAWAYDIGADDGGLRATMPLDDHERALAFDRLRKAYPVRREFPRLTVRCCQPELAETLRQLGFVVD